jgi:hypothetical protein
MDLAKLTWNTGNCTQGIDNTVSQLLARAKELEQCPDEIVAAIDHPKESRDANT